MTVAAQTIIKRVAEQLSDEATLRWTVPELVRYLNAGQRETAIIRPDLSTFHGTLTLVTGVNQALPATATKLIDVVRNAAGKQRAIRPATRELLDAFDYNWASSRSSAEISHFMYDPREPRSFMVYPPASGGASLEVVYAIVPTDVAVPADGSAVTDVTGNISLPDLLENALGDYVIYRAYAKDLEGPGHEDRAKAHYAAFLAALGAEAQATLSVGPTSAVSPNKTSSATGAPS